MLSLLGVTVPQGISQPESQRPDTGTPSGSRTPGGTRTDLAGCPETPSPLTAITPLNANGTTTATNPTLWFYIPYSDSDVTFVQLSIVDYREIELFRFTDIQLGEMPRIIGISLPEDTIALEANTQYRWYFTLSCQPPDLLDSEDPIQLNGFILPTIQTNSPGDLVWYDNLNAITSQYQANPDDANAQSAWIELLESIGLSHLADVPLFEPDE